MKIRFIICFFLFSCKASKHPIISVIDTLPCNASRAVSVADKRMYDIMTRSGYPAYKVNRSVTLIDSIFRIEYLPKDLNVRGGGGIITISQANCSIVEQKFYSNLRLAKKDIAWFTFFSY